VIRILRLTNGIQILEHIDQKRLLHFDIGLVGIVNEIHVKLPGLLNLSFGPLLGLLLLFELIKVLSRDFTGDLREVGCSQLSETGPVNTFEERMVLDIGGTVTT
jgi:hypothetical protein